MVYIKDCVCISPQISFERPHLDQEVIIHTGNRYEAVEPNYSGIIPAGILRRMGKAVRMGVTAGSLLLKRNNQVDAMIIGTANGGLQDCIKFLNQIVEYNEGTLTPTSFVQSTPNSVAGNLAVLSHNTCYNITHVNKGLAFENALLDAILLTKSGQARTSLVGAVEEISDYNFSIDFLSGFIKQTEASSRQLFKSQSDGTVAGEGAAMFLLDINNTNGNETEIIDVCQITLPDIHELQRKIEIFLKENRIQKDEVTTLILGYSGDIRTDHWYDMISQDVFPESEVLTYKNLVGDYPTATSFALWLSNGIIQNEFRPKEIIKRKKSNPEKGKILIYNHCHGIQHGFILVG